MRQYYHAIKFDLLIDYKITAIPITNADKDNVNQCVMCLGDAFKNGSSNGLPTPIPESGLGAAGGVVCCPSVVCEGTEVTDGAPVC